MLPQKDLLTARLVSKTFVCINQLPDLLLTWTLASPAAASSLALFIARHLKQQRSPNLDIRMPWIEGGNFIPLGIILACECAHLQSFDYSLAEGLEHFEASNCLRMLPPSLGHLALATSPMLMDDRGWSRLNALTSLELHLPGQRPAKLAAGSGLALLTNLKSLTLALQYWPGFDNTYTKQLTAVGFRQASITSLRLDKNFFSGRLDLGQLPRLEELHFADPQFPVPRWLSGQKLKKLVLSAVDPSQFSRIDHRNLMCEEIWAHPLPSDAPWKLSDLLLLPNLVSFHICRMDDSVDSASMPPVRVHGSSQEHKRFIDKVRVKLHVAARLCTTDADSSIDLGWNGHATICRCNECLS